MKWFKHDSDAPLDAKIQRLKLKYGMEGYGLYWHLLECIARTVEPHNLTFELEEDAELVAASTGIHYEKVQDMMMYMTDLGLFENTEGRITCLKMASRTDEYTQKLIRNSGQYPDTLRIKSGHSPEKVPPNRREEKRREEKREKKPAKRKVSLPPDFEVTDAMREWASDNVPGIDVDAATRAWKDAMIAKDFKYVDWTRAWYSGMRKALDWAKDRGHVRTPAKVFAI